MLAFLMQSPETDAAPCCPSLHVAMGRERINYRWQPWRWHSSLRDGPIRRQANSGKPTRVDGPHGEVAASYKAVVRKVAITVVAKAKDVSARLQTNAIRNNT